MSISLPLLLLPYKALPLFCLSRDLLEAAYKANPYDAIVKLTISKKAIKHIGFFTFLSLLLTVLWFASAAITIIVVTSQS